MKYRDLPPWAWRLITDLEEYEDAHSKDCPCLGALLRRVPDEARNIANVVEQVTADMKPASEEAAP